ncbi:MAG TPA: hypothetical protein VE035_09375, partial [Puia sp.]|nr:hypothetical protein [Puia sp.]
MKTKTAARRQSIDQERKRFPEACCFFLFTSLLFIQSAWGQIVETPPKKVLFKNGAFKTDRNISGGRLNQDSLPAAHYRQKYYTLVQFDRLPGIAERKELSGMGVRLFDYLPGNAFLAELPDSLSTDRLRKYTATGIYSIPGRLKLSREIQEGSEEYANSTDKLIAVSTFGSLSRADITREIGQTGAR